MRKTGQPEKLEVLRGREAQVLHEHQQRLGKYSLADFDGDEMKSLESELDQVRESEDKAKSEE
jgi:hypothetical protein